MDEISDAVYTRLRSTVNSLSVYMAKVHKEETPLRPVLSLPGSSCDHLKKNWSSNFQKIEEANVETNMKMALEVLENTVFNSDESIISLDVKNVYPNVSLNEAIEIALKSVQTGYAARFDTQDYEKTVEYDSK